MRKLFAVMVSVVVVAGLGASSAFAGEITGNGKSTPIRSGVAASLCSFSGQNDEHVEGDAAAPRTQTPAEAPPGSPGHGIETPFGTISCRGNAGSSE